MTREPSDGEAMDPSYDPVPKLLGPAGAGMADLLADEFADEWDQAISQLACFANHPSNRSPE